MQRKWKKTGAALLAVTLTVSGASYAWAADEFDTVSITKVTEKKSVDESKVEKDFSPSHTSKKLIGLLHAYEQAGDAEAKAALKKAIDRQISEYEAYVDNKDSKAETVVFLNSIIALVKAYENAPTEEAKASIKLSIKDTIASFKKTSKKEIKAEAPAKKEPIVKPVVPVEPKPEKKEKKEQKEKKAHKHADKHEKKEEKKALKEQQKLERKALKAKEKAEKKADRAKHSHERKKGKKHEDHPNHNK